MTHHTPLVDEHRPTPDYPYTARAKEARSGERVSRWLLVVAVIAAAAIFWTLAAEAFTSA